MGHPFFSIIIATYNSEETLQYTLGSISEQSIDRSDIEILVVDGGSSDNTINIAKSYNARIFENSYRLPEYAKAIGTAEARGRYIIRMDSDEEFEYKDQLRDKKAFLMEHPDVKVVIPNQIISGRKEICGISADYMNILGDPFSYFVYRTRKNKISTYRENIIWNDDMAVIMKFEEGDVYPLADSATSTLALDYIREKHADDYCSIEFTCSAFDKVISETGYCGCLYDDKIRHNCRSSFSTYLSKLRFRVVNNLFHKSESGYSSKEEMSGKLKKRKMLFCVYALLFPIPVIDSVRLAFHYRNATFLLHFVYLYYVCIQIAYMGTIKLLGGELRNTSYGK